MTAADWVAVLSPGLAIAGAVFAGTAKLTRIACAIESLQESMGTVAARVEDHERRLDRGGL